MKKALLYNPYLDVMGGGERHVLSIMALLAQAGYHVDIAWDDAQILTTLGTKLRMDVSHFNCVPNVFTKGSGFKRNSMTAQYDIFIYVTDGSYFTSHAKRNIIFSMYPDKRLYEFSLSNWYKLRGYEVIANGDFTAEKVSLWLKRDAYVIYPYIDKGFFVDKPAKSRTILGVGRFFQHLHSKRHDILIKAFTKLQQDYNEFSDFRLILAGGLKDEDKPYYDEIQNIAKINPNVIFKPNATFPELQKLYQDALIYWHAAGYDVDENVNPELVEHVGISPLEAMASRCLVFCHNSGGPKRYVLDGQNGYLYNNMDDLVFKTAQAYTQLQSNDQILDNAKLSVGTNFSFPVFKNKVEQFFKI